MDATILFRRAVPLVALLLIAPAVTRTAEARAPDPADRPSVEDVYRKAKADLDAELAQAEIEKRDPVGEAIQNYRTALVPLTEYQQVVNVLLEEEDPKIQPYRRLAAEALLERFKNASDPAALEVRREIGLAIVKLMKSAKDTEGLVLVESIFYTWWNKKIASYGFRASDKQRNRTRAYGKMKKFLEKEGD